METHQTSHAVLGSEEPVRKAFVAPTLERHQPLPQLTFDVSITEESCTGDFC